MGSIEIPSPCYVLEEEKLIHNLKLLQKVQSLTGIKVLVALKGFAAYSSFSLLKKYISGATASSLNEVKLISEEMESKAHVCGVVYFDNEIDEILDKSSHITFNSVSEFEKHKGKLSDRHKVALRVNPGFSPVEVDLYNPCTNGTRLGIRKLDKLPDGVTGLHLHALCENDSYDFENVLRSFNDNFGHLLRDLKWVNFGGGHLITKKGFDLNHFTNLINEFKKTFKGDVFIEPGSAVGWETGFLKSSVLDLVEDRGITTAILDVSFSNHMPDCLEMPYKPTVRSASNSGRYSYRLGGCTCLAGDFMDGFQFDKPLKPGDEIIFEDMIHYTMVKTTTFNGINLPSIGTLNKNGEFLLNKRFGYSDYKSRL